MKNFTIIFLLAVFVGSAGAYDKLSLVERFTNCSCGPCALSTIHGIMLQLPIL